MSKIQAIEEKSFVSAVDSARVFGYTKDYLLLLAKQGKIKGKKIGHKWFIDQTSAEVFFENAKKEREVRRRKVSLERKAEFLKSQNLGKIYDSTSSITLSSHTRSSNHALIETCAIMLIGITIGLAGYLGTSGYGSQVALVHDAEKGTGFFEKIALSLHELFSGEDALSENASTVSVLQDDTREDSSLTQNEVPTEVSSIIVAPASAFSTATAREVVTSFSDEVRLDVDPENSRMGIITPTFKNHEGEAYRFLMVPVHPEEDSSDS